MLDVDRDADVRPSFPLLESGNRPRTRYDGRAVRNFLSNNYLGLAEEASVVAAAIEATKTYGVGVTGSRLTCGNLHLHEALEAALAEFFEAPSAVVFTSGYAANLGGLGSLAKPGSTVLADQHCHPSILDGIVLAGARPRFFAHDDAAHLDDLAVEHPDAAAIVVCGVYPVRGDVADVGAAATVATARGIPLVVDEAHAFGVVGSNGRGAAELHRCRDRVAVTTVTFSKALGSFGGAVIGPAELTTQLRRAARSLRSAASAPPSSLAAAAAALQILRAQPERGRRVAEAAQDVRSAIGELAIPSGSAIITVPAGTDTLVDDTWDALLGSGILGARYAAAASPDGLPLLRFAVTAGHDRDDLDALADAISAHHVIAASR